LIIVLGDLLVDINLRFQAFPVQAGGCQDLSSIDIGPGGVTNTAIMAARLGLPVKCLGVIGDDAFGEIVVTGLAREGIDTRDILIQEGATPAAAVLVDQAAEPAYLGSAGSVSLGHFPENWLQHVKNAQGFYAGGRVKETGFRRVILEALREAKLSGVPVFFDPGPVSPGGENDWVFEALGHATVLLANQDEALALVATQDEDEAANTLMGMGPEMVVLKRGAGGITIFTAQAVQQTPGLRVEIKDKTGAGDSVTGAVIYGYLNDLSLEALGVLANAVGAAKVQKVGTGHNMPTLEDVRRVGDENDLELPL
jgi:sugar/nucleoside kinase (ribokinase family)